MKNLKLISTGLMLICICCGLLSQNKNSDPANAEDIGTWRGKTVIYFSPHPDDEIVSSGTLAILTKNGNTVYDVIFCNGNAGSHDMEMTREKLAQIRRKYEIKS